MRVLRRVFPRHGVSSDVEAGQLPEGLPSDVAAVAPVVTDVKMSVEHPAFPAHLAALGSRDGKTETIDN